MKDSVRPDHLGHGGLSVSELAEQADEFLFVLVDFVELVFGGGVSPFVLAQLPLLSFVDPLELLFEGFGLFEEESDF